MDSRKKRLITREMIIGMEVIDLDGMIEGKVRDLSLVVGERDQDLIIQDKNGTESVRRWSDVISMGDVILIRSKGEGDTVIREPGGVDTLTVPRCRFCNADLEEGDLFCDTCGKKL